MIIPSFIVTDGILLTVVFSVFVIGTLLWNPRLWLQDFPKDLQALIPPKTASEKRQTILLAIPWFIILFGGFGLTAARIGTQHGFAGMVAHVYLVWQIVNLFDLLVIDWGGMHLVDPQKPPFPGTEGVHGYRDYRFHFIGFLKGSVMGIVLAMITSIVVWLLIS